MKKILLIVPAYNEEESLPKVLTKLLGLRLACKQQVIVIDDGSTDKTRQLAKSMGVEVIKHKKNWGIGAALLSGIRYAKRENFDLAAEIDADGQHRPEDIEKLIQYLNRFDMVIGSRFIKKTKYRTPCLRRIVISCFKTLIFAGTGKLISDPTSGFRVYNKKIINLLAKGDRFNTIEPVSLVKIIKQGLSIKEVSVEMKKREAGKSSMRWARSIYLTFTISLNIILESLKTSKA